MGSAPSTWRSYNSGIRHYITFCNQANRPAVPTSEPTLLLFVSYLASRNLSYPTIKVYLAGIRSLHVATGYDVTFHSQLTPRLHQVLKGIRKEKASTLPSRIRRPITRDIMSKIKAALLKSPHSYHNIMMWAACCLAFFGFLRSSEFTIPTQSGYDPDVHLSPNDVAVDNRAMPRMIKVIIKQSKTDPFRQGVTLCLGKTDSQLCPVNALLPYLAVRGNQEGPLFIMADGRRLTRQLFSDSLDNILASLCLDSGEYNTHSFRIGAATSASEAGIPDSTIMMLGRWQSNAYQRYIKTTPEKLAQLSQTLASGGYTSRNRLTSA